MGRPELFFGMTFLNGIDSSSLLENLWTLTHRALLITRMHALWACSVSLPCDCTFFIPGALRGWLNVERDALKGSFCLVAEAEVMARGSAPGLLTVSPWPHYPHHVQDANSSTIESVKEFQAVLSRSIIQPSGQRTL